MLAMNLDKGWDQQQPSIAKWQFLQEWHHRGCFVMMVRLHTFVRSGHLTVFRIIVLIAFNSENATAKIIVTLNDMDISSHKLAHKA